MAGSAQTSNKSRRRRTADKFGMSDFNKQIAPDYERIRRHLLLINLSIAIAVFIIEVGISIIMHFSGLIEQEMPVYILRYLIVPTTINFLAVLAQYILTAKLKDMDILQNLVALVAITIICTVVASVHYVYRNTLTIFIIPIFISSAFCLRKLSMITGIMNIVGLMIAAVVRFIETSASKNSNISEKYFLPEIITSVAVIILAEIISQQIVTIMEVQKMKLVNAIAQAQYSQQEAQLANQAKSSFLENMSHEIRTPINAILGMNEMILREERQHEIREYAMNIQSSGNLLLSIINDVLDISKIESGRIEIITSSYDISSLINDCYNMAAVRARGKELQIIVNCDDNIPRLLSGDETHIRQVIVNLLTNAVKYTDTGSVTMSVGGEYSGEQYILKVSVKDTGIGIAKENLPNIFGRFSRFDLKRNRGVEGSGLGLAIVKRLVDLMDGTITVESELNVGSEFKLTIPQEVVDKSPIGSIRLNYSHSQDYGYVRSFVAPDANILAVDDLPVNLMVITNMLKCTKVHIDTAESGREAIELAKKKHYDIILMDHMMPEMDGVETYAQLRKEETMCADTPVIMLTANALAGIRERYMDEGFADYISKPVRGDKLESVIKNFLPPELVHEYDAEEQPEGNPDDNEQLSELTTLLPSINLRIALPYCCDNVEFYIDVLKQYAESKRLEEMEEQFAAENFEDYRINAHSLKSTSRTIGLEGLAERARASEFALKSGNVEYAKFNHAELMQMYREALEKIREFLKNQS